MPWNATFSMNSENAPYSWSVQSGALPAGLALDAANGAITGVPTAAGVFASTVQVTDAKHPDRHCSGVDHGCADRGSDHGDRWCAVLDRARALQRDGTVPLVGERQAAGRTHAQSRDGRAFGNAENRRRSSTTSPRGHCRRV